MPLKLPRLQGNQQLIDDKGYPTTVFVLWWQSVAERVEESINGIALALEAAGIALDAADAAQLAADNADAAALAAQGAADATLAEASIVSSFPDNFVGASPLSVDSAGIVTVLNHDRVYGDPTLNPTVAVLGDTVVTGATNPDIVRIFYDDPTRAGGAVTYQFTVDPATPPVQGGNRHSLGAVEVPASGSVDGGFVRPPGYSEVQP